jgi:hypothetical protein
MTRQRDLFIHAPPSIGTFAYFVLGIYFATEAMTRLCAYDATESLKDEVSNRSEDSPITASRSIRRIDFI